MMTKVAKVRAINAGRTERADICKKLDYKMNHISTDYIFDGRGTEPWRPDYKIISHDECLWTDEAGRELAVSQTLEKYFISSALRGSLA